MTFQDALRAIKTEVLVLMIEASQKSLLTKREPFRVEYLAELVAEHERRVQSDS